MTAPKGGYTIVEIMIVMAVTAVLFLASLLLINGQQGDVQFQQELQDVNSQILAVANEVSASNYPGSENYSCTIDPITQNPILSANNGSGSGSACELLGHAIYVPLGGNQLDVYTVVGNQATSVATDTHGINNLAIASTNDTYVLTATLPIPSAFRINFDWVRLSTDHNMAYPVDLVGLFNNPVDPNNAAAQAANPGSGTILMQEYNCGTAQLGCDPNAPPSSSTSINACIQFTNPSCDGRGATNNIDLWQVCLVSGTPPNNYQTASINFSPKGNGLSSVLDFNHCPELPRT